MNGKVPRGKLNSLETVFKLCELCKALEQEYASVSVRWQNTA